MKNFILFSILIIASLSRAEHKISLYHEQINNEYYIYADNDEFCDMSIKIEFDVQNMLIDGGNNKVYVVKAKAKKQLLTKLSLDKVGEAYSFRYKYWTNYGIHQNKKYDRDYEYNLPFMASHAFEVYQGYNGSLSHKNQNALDFTMPIGTELTAVRDGVVVKIIEKNNRNCGQEECKKYNNLISIYHPDGTFANYLHIKQNGAIVEVGDKVFKGQLIGYSGNVGWSTGPHLHLVIYNQNLEDIETLKTKFKTGDGSRAEYLVEKKKYSREYN